MHSIFSDKFAIFHKYVLDIEEIMGMKTELSRSLLLKDEWSQKQNSGGLRSLLRDGALCVCVFDMVSWTLAEAGIFHTGGWVGASNHSGGIALRFCYKNINMHSTIKYGANNHSLTVFFFF